ncbi:MAG: hypothetical protein U5K75_08290 [Ahrensia sp.]|nr:hypothetical protein [Ahrensia sp.]
MLLAIELKPISVGREHCPAPVPIDMPAGMREQNTCFCGIGSLPHGVEQGYSPLHFSNGERPDPSGKIEKLPNLVAKM